MIGWWGATRGARALLTTSTRAGSRDTAFNPATNADHEIRVALQQPDRKLLIGGMFTQFGDGPHEGIVRLQPDGALDETFTATTAGDVHALALQPDAKLLIAGEFLKSQRPGVPSHRPAEPGRLAGRELHPQCWRGPGHPRCAVQPDGHIVVGGHFNNVAGRRQGGVARFNPDGRGMGRSVRGPAHGIRLGARLAAGWKGLGGGAFETFNRKPCCRLVRLESDGAVDAGFNTGSGADGSVFAVTLQADGKIVIGGDFNRINQVECNRIARLNPDGSVDTNLRSGAGPTPASALCSVAGWQTPDRRRVYER